MQDSIAFKLWQDGHVAEERHFSHVSQEAEGAGRDKTSSADAHPCDSCPPAKPQLLMAPSV